MSVKFRPLIRGKARTEAVPIQLRIRRSRGHELAITLPVRTRAVDWSASKEQLKPGTRGALSINRQLTSIRHKVEGLLMDGQPDDIIRSVVLERIGRETEEMRRRLTQGKDETILELYERFVEYKAARNQASTMRTYAGIRGHLRAGVPEDATPGTIGAAWLDDLATKMLSAGLSNSSVNKNVSRISGFLDWLKDRRFIDQVPEAPRFSTARNDAVYLTRQELARLMAVDLSDVSQGRRDARDLFVVASVTGQRYSDLQAMRWEDIRGEGESLTWNFHVKKTAVTLRVPLIGPARRVVESRREEGYVTPLPKLVNQKANKYIKDISRMAGLDELVTEVQLFGRERRVLDRPKHEAITMHASRKTFITLSLQDGVLEPADLLGFTHDDLRTLTLYKGRDNAALRVKMREAFGGL